MKHEKINVLGISYNRITIGELVDLLRINTNVNSNKLLIGNHNLHSVYLFHRVKGFPEFYKKCVLIHADGMPLIFWAKILRYAVNRDNRITYVDLFPEIMKMANEKGLRIFFLGGKPENSSKIKLYVDKEYPKIIFDSHHGYFIQDKGQIANQINDFNPEILIVGMGMPRQELWILENYNSLGNFAIMQAGACFDYFIGENSMPPRWMGRIGLEWAYRFLRDPKRLFSRYFIEAWFILYLCFKDVVSGDKK